MKGYGKWRDGYLVAIFLWPLRYWLNYCGWTAWAPLRPARRAHEPLVFMNRDTFVLCMLFLSTVAFLAWQPSHPKALRAAIGGLVVYRVWDLGLTFFALGFFGAVRADAPLARLPVHRIQRILLIIVFGYIELLFLFAQLYFWLGSADNDQFHEVVACHRQAFFVSMTTITTVGYGRYSPAGTLAIVLTTIQAILGLLVVVFVIGVLVTLAGERRRRMKAPRESLLRVGPERVLCHIVPILTPIAFMLVTYVCLEP